MSMAIKILGLDIDHGPQALLLEEQYNACRILVRKGARPLGWIQLEKPSGGLLHAQVISDEIRKVLGRELEHQFLLERLFQQEEVQEYQPVSVIVCTRNRTSMLEKCLSALVALDYPSFEIIVVDNAPSDNTTHDLVASLGLRYVLEERKGLDRARNRGILEAGHGIVAFTDDDALVDRSWLQVINRVFTDPSIAAVSGFVAPVELETGAQQVFELAYGGMAHGVRRRYFNRSALSQQELIWSSAMGIGANMAFRKSIFQSIGLFDEALDVGTPTGGGGDIEMFHRLVVSGAIMMYEPSLLVWHHHRRTNEDLQKLVYQNGLGFGAYLSRSWEHRTISRLAILQFFFKNWLWQWNLKNLLSPRPRFPRKLALLELKGMMQSYGKYRESCKLQAASCKSKAVGC